MPSLVASGGAKSGRSALSEYTRDWKRLRAQKHRSRGGLEGRVITNLGFWYGEHYLTQTQGQIIPRPQGRDEDRNHLFLVFNLFKKHVRRKLGRIWSVDPSVDVTPNSLDPIAMDKADVANNLIRALDRRLSERTQHWIRLWWLALGGSVVEHVPWIEEVGDEMMPQFDPTTHELLWIESQTGSILPQSKVESLCMQGLPAERFKPYEQIETVGDVGSQIVTPLNFFIDASVPLIDRLAPDQKCYIAEIKTKGWIEDVFGSEAADNIEGMGSDLTIVETRLLDKGPSVSNVNLRDMIPAIQGVRTAEDPEMAIVITGYSPPSKKNPNGERCIFVPGQYILDEDEIPYGSMPLVDLHWEPPTTTFWTGDFGTDLVPANKFLNKRMSQLGEQSNAAIYELLLLGGGLTPADIPTDFPGAVEGGLGEDGNPLVQPMARGQLPAFFMDSIKLIVEMLESLGSSDLTQSRQFPGQLRGPLALPILQELLDSEDGPFYEHMGEQLAKIKQLRLNRVKQYYPPIRTLHYNTGLKNEVLVFHTEDVLRSGVDYDVTIDPASLVPEISALRRARVREDLESAISIVYTDPRTGRIDPTRVAKALKYGDRDTLDRETQWRSLARHIIAKLWAAEDIDPRMPWPFWDFSSVMDELEAEMARTEWIDSSEAVKDGFLNLYDKCRQQLDAIQQAQGQAAQAQQMQSAVSQATQQVAAKVAAETVQASIEQIREGLAMATSTGPQLEGQLTQILGQGGAPNAGPQGRLNPNLRPTPPRNLTRPAAGQPMDLQQLRGR